MADSQAAGEERAAGAVLWRPANRGTHVALVHRPKYDDWSFAKGKVEPGEHVLLTARREVAEETGMWVQLGRRLRPVRYVNGDVPKRVDYWVATPESSAGFTATSEVDKVAWIAASRAVARLSYERDVQTLAEFRAGPRRTVPLILVRHASAGSKSDWGKDDMSRPLDAHGQKDAESLAGLLRCFGVCRVISSPAQRCIATVAPYAASAGVQVETEPAFAAAGKGAPDNPAASKAAAQLAAEDQPTIICAHRENLPSLLDAACAELGTDSPAGRPVRKGEFLVLHRADRRLAAFERYHPDGDS
jgi:8-oxo-dGTP pyrophosphatase MutT (NUDIX family)/phosphohistidine phosphatase SixA